MAWSARAMIWSASSVSVSLGPGDSDACSNVHAFVADVDVMLHNVGAFGGESKRGCRGYGCRYDDELVASEPANATTSRDGGVQPANDRVQHGIACAVSEPVVDRFELIHVQVDDRCSLGGGGDPVEGRGPAECPREGAPSPNTSTNSEPAKHAVYSPPAANQ